MSRRCFARRLHFVQENLSEAYSLPAYESWLRSSVVVTAYPCAIPKTWALCKVMVGRGSRLAHLRP